MCGEVISVMSQNATHAEVMPGTTAAILQPSTWGKIQHGKNNREKNVDTAWVLEIIEL